MKNSACIITFFALLFFTCSNDSIDGPDMSGNELSLTNYIYKTYNVSNTPNTVKDSTNYQINTNRITSTSGLNLETSLQRTSNYTYTDGKIDEIQSFTNGSLVRIQSFTYNGNDDLVEYLSESISANDQTSSFEKHLFNHTTDTIFSSWTRSNDGISFDINISDFKIVLDDNDNRTYLEIYSYLNDDTKFEINTYDSNSNILNESKYLILDNNIEVLAFENNYTSNSSENLFNRINEATFTRKSMMLLYHLQSNAVNNINAKSISKNVLTSFQSTIGNSFVDFEILNSTDNNNMTIYSDFKSSVGDDILSRFSQEFIIQ